MTTRRTTSSKRDRERAKQARAAAKRDRRAARAAEHTDAAQLPDDGATAAEILQQLKEVHDSFNRGTLSFDDFDQEKTRLLERLAAGLPDTSE